jgi:transposase InsO family protein
MEFVVAAHRKEKNFQSLCAEFAISRPTGYRWLRRYQSEGVRGMEERSRRPHGSPERTPRGIEEQVLEWRRGHPDWGARKIRVLLGQQGVGLASSTIHRMLLRHDLIGAAQSHRAAVQRFEREAPNQLWQMDFKGPKGWHERVGPLSVLDDHSRYALALAGTGNTRGASVQRVLAETFQHCGVPEQMLMDHGCPWWNEQGIRGWTSLTVWLMQQDIQLYFSGYNHPQTQGKVERFHRTLTAALLRRGAPAEGSRQVWLDGFRQEYNHLRPHEALQMKTPSQLWSPSARPYQPKPAEWQYPAEAEVQQVDRHGLLQRGGQRYWISGALAGEAVGLVEVGERILVYYRRTLIRELDPRAQQSTPVEFA